MPGPGAQSGSQSGHPEVPVRGLIAGFFLSVSLCAQSPATGWQRMPSLGTAPEVRYRLREDGQGLRLEVNPRDVDLSKWALHLWLGDPRIVEARQRHLAEIRDAIQDAERRLTEADHQEDPCQASLHAFLGKAFSARARFRAFDPYAHLRLFFQDPKAVSTEELRGIQLEPRKDAAGAVTFTGTIAFKGDLDAAAGTLGSLSYGLSYLPLENAGSRPGLRAPRTLPLPQPWKLEPFLAAGTPRLRLLLGHTEVEQIYMSKVGGYELAPLGQQDESACFGVEGRFVAPDVWSPWPRDAEIRLPAPGMRFQFSYIKGRGARLAIQAQPQKDPRLLDLAAHLNSHGEEGIQLLDCKDALGSTWVLLNITGDSRPGSPMGHCGAGQEENVIWLKLGPDGQLLKVESFLVDSCLESIDATFDRPGQGAWTWAWTDPEAHLDHTLSYDPQHPELGLRDATEPAEGD